jgi:RimJ/RimL family protein N-acetyltransferase
VNVAARAKLEPVVLTGRVVRLEPMLAEHVDALWEAGRHPELYTVAFEVLRSRADMARYVSEALDAAARGVALPFVTRLASSGEIVGSTRFAAFEPAHERVEIGWTWITPAHQRTAVNTEAKLLMLVHAFETLGLGRVELKTDVLNERSQRAMERLGFVREGVLRRHMVASTGRLRDSVYYSAIREEWPALKARIEGLLAR